MQPDRLSPHAWLERQPIQPSEQMYAVFGSASAAQVFKAWQLSNPLQAPRPIWADTAYAEWEAVMPYLGIVSADSEFLRWVATTESLDWGWLAVSFAPLEAVVEHLRSLTQVLLPNGNAVFFRFWDGRYLLPILQASEVDDAAQLLPVIGRCLINGQSLEVGGAAQTTARVFPWWEVPATLLEQLARQSSATLVSNLSKWLSEDRPDLHEAFSPVVLTHKIAIFLETPEL
ncbi:MAG: DUF4123 domain-containing protein, partial [Pseudomonadota bacterium]|nr:DUF4123 domain-containing protein [Pseudomonadota bacterium]